MGSKAEAPRRFGEEIRRHPPRAEKTEELRGHRQAAARLEPDALAFALSDHRPLARKSAQVQSLAHHASRAGVGRADPRIEESNVVDDVTYMQARQGMLQHAACAERF